MPRQAIKGQTTAIVLNEQGVTKAMYAKDYRELTKQELMAKYQLSDYEDSEVRKYWNIAPKRPAAAKPHKATTALTTTSKPTQALPLPLPALDGLDPHEAAKQTPRAVLELVTELLLRGAGR